jgi:hypothetical protein
MSAPIPCLIQINGDNVAANLLPIMALRPERIVQLVTKSQRAERAVAQFRDAFSLLAKEAGYEGYKPKIQDHTLASTDMPDVRDTVARLLLENQGAVLNFSGGSKLMSLGAYQAALALGRPSLFCDVDEERFVNGRTGSLQAPVEYQKLADQLSIRLLMALHGRRHEEWQAQAVSEPLRAFGLRAYELRLQHWSALEAFNQALRTALPSLGDKALPAALSQSEAARLYLTAAAAAGLVKQVPEGWRVLGAVEQTEAFLTRSWLELAVLDRILVNPSYRDVMWNPTRADEGRSSGIFAVDSRGMKLRYIESLPSLTHSPHDHLEAVAQRSRQLGGAAAEATLVVLRPAQGQDNALRHTARRLGVEVIIGAEEIARKFARS